MYNIICRKNDSRRKHLFYLNVAVEYVNDKVDHKKKKIHKNKLTIVKFFFVYFHKFTNDKN